VLNRPALMLAATAALAIGLAAPAAAGPQIPGLPKSKELTELIKRTDSSAISSSRRTRNQAWRQRQRARARALRRCAGRRRPPLRDAGGHAARAESTRPNLPFRFIVLDTDGVNAFAAPGGYIHITRGALGLMASESELAGVLAHEISHVTRKHTIGAIQKNKVIQIGAEESITRNPSCGTSSWTSPRIS